MPFASDAELFARIRADLYTAVVGDVIDRSGLRAQFLPPNVRPLRSDMVVAGRAVPVVIGDTPGTADDPFGKLLEALDSLRENDVYITNGGHTPYALWGELMSTRAKRLKAAGAVMNGYARDEAGILELGFPTFCHGSYALDMSFRGKVLEYGVPSRVGDVLVSPGDVVFGDRDGVLIVPANMAHEIFDRALEKVHGENLVRDAFREGMSAVEAFAKYGVM